MCGICGLVEMAPDSLAASELVQRMNAAITHRGPDSDGFYYDDSVALAMRRLAIVDLSTGDQPMTNEDGTVWLVFNGEIFNYPELRPALESLGHTFRTQSDTEAIVHLYEEYGLNCVDHLRGQFAIAIWDSVKQRLLLARDRTGQKPLYYAFSEPVQLADQFRLPARGGFYFGSELNSLLEAPLQRRVNLKAIDHYLTLMYVPDPWTAFEGIYKLPPGHRMVLDLSDRRQASIERYWDLPFEPKWEGDPDQLRRELRDEIHSAVEIRLMSDVPLGAHLSGGIDSSIVVGLMAGMMDKPVQTFAIGFPESRYDETRFARDISQRFGTDHHEFVMQADTMDVLPQMVRHFGEPFADPAALPTWYLAQMTREHVTVALNGDGGDEAFAGYQRYFGDLYVDLYRKIPGPLRRRVLRPLIDRLPTQADRPMEQSYTAALRGLARGAEVSHAASKVRWSTHFQEDEKRALYTPEMHSGLNGRSSADLLSDSFYQAVARHRIDRTLYTDLHHYLPGALLPKVDRMTMAHSLEARSPFLDHKVLELAARLPVSWKVRGQTTKWILRDLFKDLLPQDITTRKKSGFSVPLGPWFAGELYGPASDLLCSPSSRVRTYLKTQPLTEMLEENRRGQHNHGKRIWTLLNLELWLRAYFG
jgi:asparagine synthase (glutamine-hydrolysing)